MSVSFKPNGAALSAAAENRREAARANRQGTHGDAGGPRPEERNSNREVVRVVNRLPINVWLLVHLAAKKIGRSTDTVERRGVPWVDHYVPFKVRYKYQVLDEGAQATKVYLEEDLEKLMVAPADLPRSSRPRFIPRFVRRKPLFR